jgi:hypothetical protein
MVTVDTTTTNIAIPYPDAGELHLQFGIGACQFSLVPGNGDAWLTGTYDDPSGALPLHIAQEGGTVRVTQGQRFEAFPRLFGEPARFDLHLGTARPFTLTLETGASEIRCELGSIPLTGLTIRQGAGKATIDFATPNPQTLDALEIGAGAAEFQITRLANANARQIRAGGGAASYLFDFGGVLSGDTNVRINAGMADVTVRVPATTAAKIAATAVLGAVDIDDGFTKQGGAFCTPAALTGQSPCLMVHASAALGTIHIRAS